MGLISDIKSNFVRIWTNTLKTGSLTRSQFLDNIDGLLENGRRCSSKASSILASTTARDDSDSAGAGTGSTC